METTIRSRPSRFKQHETDRALRTLWADRFGRYVGKSPPILRYFFLTDAGVPRARSVGTGQTPLLGQPVPPTEASHAHASPAPRGRHGRPPAAGIGPSARPRP